MVRVSGAVLFGLALVVILMVNPVVSTADEQDTAEEINKRKKHDKPLMSVVAMSGGRRLLEPGNGEGEPRGYGGGVGGGNTETKKAPGEGPGQGEELKSRGVGWGEGGSKREPPP